MSRVIAVSPAQSGWTLRIDAKDCPLVFTSGAQAEITARSIAYQFARAGQAADILIYLRDGSLAGRLCSTPQHPAARPRNEAGPLLEPAAA